MSEIDPQYLLFNHSYFLVPIKLEDGKMFMWYSICSRHRSHDASCDLCQAGSWHEIRQVEEDNGMD